MYSHKKRACMSPPQLAKMKYFNEMIIEKEDLRNEALQRHRSRLKEKSLSIEKTQESKETFSPLQTQKNLVTEQSPSKKPRYKRNFRNYTELNEFMRYKRKNPAVTLETLRAQQDLYQLLNQNFNPQETFKTYQEFRDQTYQKFVNRTIQPSQLV